jgi:hypothetical protein
MVNSILSDLKQVVSLLEVTIKHKTTDEGLEIVRLYSRVLPDIT